MYQEKSPTWCFGNKQTYKNKALKATSVFSLRPSTATGLCKSETRWPLFSAVQVQEEERKTGPSAPSQGPASTAWAELSLGERSPRCWRGGKLQRMALLRPREEELLLASSTADILLRTRKRKALGRPSSQHREEGGFLTGTGKGGAARHCDQSPAAETCARGSGRPLRTTSPPAPLPSSTPLPAGRSGQAPAPGSAM